ncbi:potassium channel, subfamily K, member 16-like isoform X2 [Pyxicephalus adspersus]|uniref:potassium channel, subfamily K, member 16-like isoform X2 n=1 Tax=Pyxicephalus adspersus TaxID=30357 RepID=UPI003B5CF7D9
MWKKLFKLLKNVLLAVVFSVYLAFGAVVFHYLEKEAESKIKAETERHRLDILNNYTCLPHDALEHLIKIVTVAVKQGLNPLENSTTSKHTNWDISSAFFFSGTVVTTIGYGTIAPQTAGGQIFCVGYALFGIPLNIFVLSRVGKHLSHYCKGLEKRLVKKGMKKGKGVITHLRGTASWCVSGSFLVLPGFHF